MLRRQVAVAAVLNTGSVPPPRGPAALYDQLFVSYQTSMAASVRNWLLKDLGRLGKLLGADPLQQIPFALSLVLRTEHRVYQFSKSSTALLACAGMNADSASRFASALGRVVSDILVNTPFESAAAGRAQLADTALTTGHRASRRTKARTSTSASLARKAGLVAEQPDEPVPETETKFAKNLAKEVSTALSEVIVEYAIAVAKALQASGELPLAESAGDDLKGDLLRALFRLVADRNRHLEISINLCEPREPKACQDKTLQALLGGGAPLNAEKFQKGLVGLTMTVRRMLGLSDEELLPVSAGGIPSGHVS